jgi:hypothetical protein
VAVLPEAASPAGLLAVSLPPQAKSDSVITHTNNAIIRVLNFLIDFSSLNF